jgi:hypothetical protein
LVGPVEVGDAREAEARRCVDECAERLGGLVGAPGAHGQRTGPAAEPVVAVRVFSLALNAGSTSSKVHPRMPRRVHLAKSAARAWIATAALMAEEPPSVLPRSALIERLARPVAPV